MREREILRAAAWVCCRVRLRSKSDWSEHSVEVHTGECHSQNDYLWPTREKKERAHGIQWKRSWEWWEPKDIENMVGWAKCNALRVCWLWNMNEASKNTRKFVSYFLSSLFGCLFAVPSAQWLAGCLVGWVAIMMQRTCVLVFRWCRVKKRKQTRFYAILLFEMAWRCVAFSCANLANCHQSVHFQHHAQYT